MNVTNFRKRVTQKMVYFSADFYIRQTDVKKKVFFAVPKKYAQEGNIEDAFFVAAVPMAMALEENLEFDGIVSKELYENIYKIKSHINEAATRIRLNVRGVTKRQKRSTKNGLFFTLGVDSLHSLIMGNKTLPVKNRISYLLNISGSLSFKTSVKVNSLISQRIRAWAKRTHTEAILMETNLRELSDTIISWDYFHGAAIAAAAHLLSPLIGKMYISNCEDYFLKWPYGTKKELDPLWSSESLKFVSIFPNKHRLDKIGELLRVRKMRKYLMQLWVCFAEPENDKITNCGICAKCIRTYLCFMAQGMREPILTFPRLDPQMIDSLPTMSSHHQKWETVLHLLRKRPGVDQKIITSLERYIERRRKYVLVEELTEFKKNTKKYIKKVVTRAGFMDTYREILAIYRIKNTRRLSLKTV